MRQGGEGRTLCALYVRLSREDEDRQQPESESIQNQKALLMDYAEERGWDVYEIYSDEDYSGVDRLRPAFNRMLQAAEEGAFQILLCKSQSRFTRDLELVEKYIHGMFPLWGVRFIAVADNADTEVKGNKKARQINGLVNEWYLEDLSENVRMVLDMKRREGQYIGGVPLYGYRKDPADKNKLVLDQEAAETVRRIFRWALEGCGRQRIAHMLNDEGVPGPARYKAAGTGPHSAGDGLWSKTAVWRILHNEMYTGVMVQGRRKKASYKSKKLVSVPENQWYRVEGTHGAIVCRETFDAVQRNLRLRSKTGGAGEPHLLSGLVKCMDCGSTLSKVTNGKPGGAAYLRCRLYADSGGEKRCTRHSVRLDRLIDLVSERIRQDVRSCCAAEPLKIRPAPRDLRGEALERERKMLAGQMEKRSYALRELYLDKVSGLLGPEEFKELTRSFQEEKTCMERRLEKIGEELASRIGNSPQADPADRIQALLKLERVPRELVTALVEKIEVGERDLDTGEQKVRITWRL